MMPPSTSSQSATIRNRKDKRNAAREKSTEILGRVVSIRYYGEDTCWVVGTLQPDETSKYGSRINFTGTYHKKPEIGARLLLSAQVETHPKYGDQYKCSLIAADLSIDNGGLVEYIGNQQSLKGIGPAKARELVAEYQSADAILREIVSLGFGGFALKHKIKADTVQKLDEILRQDKVDLETKTWLSGVGLTQYQIGKIMAEYGGEARAVLEKSPYDLIKDVAGFGFQRADEIALRTGTSKNSECRLRAGILYTLDRDIEDGHTWIGRGDLIEKAYKTLKPDDVGSREILSKLIDDLICDGEIVEVDCRIALPKFHEWESFVVDFLASARKEFNPLSEELTIAIDWDCGLTDDQRKAAVFACLHKNVVITGGAGVGKTFLISKIIEAYKAAGIPDRKILCLAPTGKAARRMADVSGHDAETIHRALQYNGHAWGKGEYDRLDADVVIIDEFSMVDVELAYRLFVAIDPDNTNIIIVGDHQQLPSVGPGSLLRDLVSADGRIVKVATLTECVRQAGLLKECCGDVLRGVLRETPKNYREWGEERSPWYVLPKFNWEDPRGFYDFLRSCVRGGLLERNFGMNAKQDLQLLAAKKSGGYGVDVINAVMQQAIQKEWYDVDVDLSALDLGAAEFDVSIDDSEQSDGVDGSAESPSDEKCAKSKQASKSKSKSKNTYREKILVGDRVIQTVNNRDLGVMNGQIGWVRSIDRGDMYVEFDGAAPNSTITKKYTKIQQANLRLAYCLTIHKSQGSEFPLVIVVCSRSQRFMLNRNLLYTGVTRARKIAIVAGDPIGIKSALECTDAGKRRTWASVRVENVHARDCD